MRGLLNLILLGLVITCLGIIGPFNDVARQFLSLEAKTVQSESAQEPIYYEPYSEQEIEEVLRGFLSHLKVLEYDVLENPNLRDIPAFQSEARFFSVAMMQRANGTKFASCWHYGRISGDYLLYNDGTFSRTELSRTVCAQSLLNSWCDYGRSNVENFGSGSCDSY